MRKPNPLCPSSPNKLCAILWVLLSLPASLFPRPALLSHDHLFVYNQIHSNDERHYFPTLPFFFLIHGTAGREVVTLWWQKTLPKFLRWIICAALHMKFIDKGKTEKNKTNKYITIKRNPKKADGIWWFSIVLVLGVSMFDLTGIPHDISEKVSVF